MLGSLGHFVFTRVEEEKERANLSFAMTYSDVEFLSKLSQEPITDWLNYFEEKGINDIFLENETIYSMINSGKSIDINLIINLKMIYSGRISTQNHW